MAVKQISGEVCSTSVPRLKLESGAFSFLGGQLTPTVTTGLLVKWRFFVNNRVVRRLRVPATDGSFLDIL